VPPAVPDDGSAHDEAARAARQFKGQSPGLVLRDMRRDRVSPGVGPGGGRRQHGGQRLAQGQAPSAGREGAAMARDGSSGISFAEPRPGTSRAGGLAAAAASPRPCSSAWVRSEATGDPRIRPGSENETGGLPVAKQPRQQGRGLHRWRVSHGRARTRAPRRAPGQGVQAERTGADLRGLPTSPTADAVRSALFSSVPHRSRLPRVRSRPILPQKVRGFPRRAA